MANYQFPMEGMMGPSTPIDRITAGSSMFTPGQGKAPTAGEQVVASEARDKYFQELLNRLGGAGAAAGNVVGSPTGQLVAGLGAPVAFGLGSLAQGDIPRGVGEIGGGVAGAGLVGGLAQAAQTALPGTRGKIASAGIRAVGGLVGGAVGGGVAGQAAQAVGNVASAVTGQQREAGKTPGILPGSGTGVGLDATTQKELAILRELQKYGIEGTVAGAQAMLPIQNQYLDAQMQRQMQLNQQTGQLTGALNRQQYAFQLAQGAQSEAGANLRTMISSNPYASSAFRY